MGSVSGHSYRNKASHTNVSSSPTLSISCVFDDNHLTCFRWHVTVVLICISLMISHIGHVFRYLLAIFLSSLEKSSIQILWIESSSYLPTNEVKITLENLFNSQNSMCDFVYAKICGFFSSNSLSLMFLCSSSFTFYPKKPSCLVT